MSKSKTGTISTKIASGLLAVFVCVAAPFTSANAADTACPQFFHGGQAPDIELAALVDRFTEVCLVEVGVGHSGISATPLYAGQHLTADRVLAAKDVAREDAFYAEPAIASSDRAELDHYSGSGLDRGHLAPSADMSTRPAQEASFSLANVMPQHAALNRYGWADVEATTRALALSYGEIYVVTGPAFITDDIGRIGGRVLVPSHVYKAIYIPSADAAAVYIAVNDEEDPAIDQISVTRLGDLIGLDVFPVISEEVKANAVQLPKPERAMDLKLLGRWN